MHVRRTSTFCDARMYSGNSVRLNKSTIRWKGIFFRGLCCFYFIANFITIECSSWHFGYVADE